MTGTVTNFSWKMIDKLTEDLGRFDLQPYVHVSQAGGAYCGATLLFDLFGDGDNLSAEAVALMKSTSQRFKRDSAFRSALSSYCFQLGTYVQNWNDPAPDVNFDPPSFRAGGAA